MNKALMITRLAVIFFWIVITIVFLKSPVYLSPKPARSITILAWPNIIDRDYFSDFEKKSGIKVYLSYFENYEELFVKLKSGGTLGYDLVMTSDYMAELLIRDNLLEKINKEKCPFWNRLNSLFLNHYFDPLNQFTLPYSLSLYGLGVDLDCFDGVISDPSWALLFQTDHVGMPDDAREVILIAAHYLFGSIDDVDDEKLVIVKEMLREQKKRVEMYTDLRTDYLLFSKTAAVVAAMHPDLTHAVESTPNIRFVLPKEGVFGVMDSFALVKGSPNQSLSYSFLNFLYEKRVMEQYVKRYKFISPLIDVYCPKIASTLSNDELVKSVHFFRNVLSSKKLMNCWIGIKA